MEVVHLNQKQLAVRWSISEASLERWRSEGIGLPLNAASQHLLGCHVCQSLSIHAIL